MGSGRRIEETVLVVGELVAEDGEREIMWVSIKAPDVGTFVF